MARQKAIHFPTNKKIRKRRISPPKSGAWQKAIRAHQRKLLPKRIGK